MPAAFWMGWSAGLTVIGLVWLVWWSVSIYRARAGTIAIPDDVWDEDLTEGNADPPKWWFYSLFAALIYSSAYILAYPGLSGTYSLLGWSQHSQLSSGLEHYREKTQAIHQRWANAPLAELTADQSAMTSARRIYASSCAACHGDNAAGQAGLFPDLTDSIWHWGSTEAALIQTLTEGRTGVMPGWQETLGTEQVEQVTDYILALSEQRGKDAAFDAGRKVYATTCAVCHGDSGLGKQELGAPGFVEHKWQYVKPGENLREAMISVIAYGRTGIMPAQQGRLTPSQIRILAAWLAGGRQIAPLN